MKAAGVLPGTYLMPGTCAPLKEEPTQQGVLANDIHSQLNLTRMRASARVASVAGLQQVVRDARRDGFRLSIAGGRHAMGGQQFLTDGVLVDMRGMNRILSFERERGLVEVEAGIEWPALIDYLGAGQAGSATKWTIAQKQTGADSLSLGGALAANIHGRGLAMKPIIADVESFKLVTAAGEVLRCSRDENAELFKLAIGGYGLFGIIASVTLRLRPRVKVERVVDVVDVGDLIGRFDARIAEGFLYGDWQFSTDARSPNFLQRGVFSCYRPVDPATPIPEGQVRLSPDQWRQLLLLGHTDRAQAYERYVQHYQSTSGQIYWSDFSQLATYLENYHHDLDRQLSTGGRGSEMITEAYVPRESLPAFMAGVAEDLRASGAPLIYGTVRLIERDDESFLAWAKQAYACIVFNLHVDHNPADLDKAAQDFRDIIDRAIASGGSYYLTYHRWATRQQLEACYPQFADFLAAKRRHDPDDILQSDWYRHYRDMFGGA